MRKNIRSSSSPKALAASFPMPPLADAMDAVRLSVDRFCLLAGVEALAEMMEEDATTVCGARHRRHGDRRGYRWGRTQSEIGYHGGKVKVSRPRVRDRAGKEVSLESWQVLRDGDLLLEWALNLMVLNVSTRKYHRAVRLPEGDLAKAGGDGTSKSAVSRRFVALSRKKMKAWLASDLSELDLLVIQIDGLHVGDHVLVAAIGVDGNGDKHVLAVVEGATENTATVQALLDNLDRITHLPAYIVHGRYDVICPVDQAFALHEQWPNSELKVISDAGHAVSEPGITRALVDSTNAMLDRVET